MPYSWNMEFMTLQPEEYRLTSASSIKEIEGSPLLISPKISQSIFNVLSDGGLEIISQLCNNRIACSVKDIEAAI